MKLAGAATFLCALLVAAVAVPLAAFGQAGGAADAGGETALSAHKLATHMYKTGDFKEAAKLYHTAYRLDPQPAFLFNAARSEQRLMMLEVAEAHFKELIALPNLDAATRSRATLHLDEVKAVRAALARAKTATRPVVDGAAGAPPPPESTKAPATHAAENPSGAGAPSATAKDVAAAASATTKDVAAAPSAAAATVAAPPSDWQGTAGWAALGSGAVLAGVGVWLLVSYSSDQAALDKRRTAVNDQGKSVDISYEQYEQEQQALWTQSGLGIGASAVGLAAAGAGAWMLWSAPQPAAVAIVPMGRGAKLAWRF